MAFNFEQFYSTHNTSLTNFAERFNNLVYEGCDDEFYNLFMVANRRETYTNDGTFVQADIDKCCGFDWEHRQTGYKSFGEFEYGRWGLGQYGTKLAKPSIKITLQISTDGTGLLVAWHSDYEKLSDVKLPSQTKKNRVEKMGKTYHFIEYDISTDEGLLKFKKMIYNAIMEQNYTHTIFAA